MTEPLDVVGAMMYLAEVRALADSILFRTESIEKASAIWMHHQGVASAQVVASNDEWSAESFNGALRVSAGQQSVLFDDFEAVLAAWARLSLLLHPVPGGPLSKWREERGRILRELVQLDDSSLLSDRSFRDSWMHFDERLDNAYLEKWLGNRQQFVRSTDVASAIEHSIRVIDVEARAYHYRDRTGNKKHVPLQAMKECVQAVVTGLSTAKDRLGKLPHRKL